MTAPFWTSDNGETQVTLYRGHVLDILRELEGGSVHCVVTSPPYWGLRDYGLPPLVWGGDPACGHERGERIRGRARDNQHVRESPLGHGGPKSDDFNHSYESSGAFCACGAWRGALGLEPQPDLYVQHMVEVFRAVRRVLRDDGTVWLNMGDAYAGGARESNPRVRDDLPNPPAGWGERDATVHGRTAVDGLKPKDMLGMPWRVAFALQQDGWYLRSDIIWAKPNPMPESVTDRPTKAHEYVFLLSRSERYYYDADAIREKGSIEAGHWAPFSDTVGGRAYAMGRTPSGNEKPGQGWTYNGFRNKRTVWEIATQPYPDAHFATFPEALVEPCVLAGTSDRGCCERCGATWKREVERQVDGAFHLCPKDAASATSRGTTLDSSRLHNQYFQYRHLSEDWHPTCDHEARAVPCTVLDPFAGSGTALLVAQRLGRDAVGIELSTDYCDLARHRLEPAHGQMQLFPR